MINNLFGLALRISPGKQLCLNSFPLLISIRNETHYDILKLPQSCTSKEIREAFISLSKENHPDKHRNDPSMHRRFVKINEAYRTLIKPSSRVLYDQTVFTTRKIKPYTSSSYSEIFEEDFQNTNKHDFSDPFMWHNVKNGRQTTDSYYGIKGVKKTSNSVILCLVLAFTLVGAVVQYFVIRIIIGKRSELLLEQTKRNSIIEGLVKEKAQLYGNEHQIEVFKNSQKTPLNLTNDKTVTESETSIL